jgi:hypothetical protein
VASPRGSAFSRAEEEDAFAKVLEIDDTGKRRTPRVLTGTGIVQERMCRRLSLDDYFVQRVLTTLDGDTRPRLSSEVLNSRLTAVHVDARLSPEPQGV